MHTIYIVEDDSLVTEHLRLYLLEKGYDVAGTAATAEAAIAAIEVCQPTLIITDIVLAGDMDGIEAARIINERFDIPVIYLTAYRDKSFFERARQAPPCAYLLKPFNEDELVLTIDMAINRYQIIKRMQKALKLAEQEHIAKAEYISRLSHEIYSPLNAIIGFSHLLQFYEKDSLSPRQLEYIEEISMASQAMLAQVKQVHDLRRIESEAVTESS